MGQKLSYLDDDITVLGCESLLRTAERNAYCLQRNEDPKLSFLASSIVSVRRSKIPNDFYSNFVVGLSLTVSLT